MLPKETKDCYNNAKSYPLLTPFSSSSSTKCLTKSKRKYHSTDFTNYFNISLIVISLILLSTLDTVSSLTCPVNQYLCADGNQCIIEIYLCDNDKDCEDGSDETRCSPPSFVDTDFGDRFLREGENLSLSCQAVGFPTPLIRWKFNDHFITSHNSRYRISSINGHGKLSITGVRKEDEGTLECVAENANNYIHPNSVVKLRVRTRGSVDENKISRVKDHSQHRGPLTRLAPYEDAVLLRQITNNYSAPLVAAFLHSRIQKTIQMVRDIKNWLKDLSQNQRNFFNLKVKRLETLDKQLTSLRKINYFNFDGTERIQYLIEQYIVYNIQLPIELVFEEAKFNATLDNLLEQINITSNDILIKYTKDLIKVYLQDIEEREVNKKYNELQRFAAFLTKRKLEPLINLQYRPADHLSHDGQIIGTIDNRGSQIEFVLHQLKDTLDLFYTQFENLATQSATSSSLEPVTSKVKGQCLAKPVSLEDGVLLRQIADSYSAPLVVPFLHSRIQNNAQMIEEIKNSLENLSENQRNLFTLKVKSLEALDKQLTSLQKTDYFNFDGTARVKNLIEQYILNNEMFPIELGFEEAKGNSTPDDLLKQVNVMSNDNLIKDTNVLINVYLEDIEEKESNEKYNELQRLTASLAKHKLKTLVNFKYTEPTEQRNHYGNYLGTTDNRAPQIESVLRQLKNILDIFYPQFENLATRSAPLKPSSLKPVVVYPAKVMEAPMPDQPDFALPED